MTRGRTAKPGIVEADILRMSYLDFIGFINQWNVPPGAFSTLTKWAEFSKLDRTSKLLELACNSGFTSRELSLLYKCNAIGIDTSKPLIEMANYNKHRYAPDAQISYVNEDALNFKPRNKFTHVAIGAALKFFPNPTEVVRKIVENYLGDGGYILASPFYVYRQVPNILVRKARKVFGISITTENYKTIMKTYEGLEVLFEDRSQILPESMEELEHYCNSTIERACEIRGIVDPGIKKVMLKRLMDIKKMSNDLRPYQMYSVLVLRYRSQIYPNRYVELF